jgi:hypothetical protein
MSFLSKVELKKQLGTLGIKIEGNSIKRADIAKILASTNLTNKDSVFDVINAVSDYEEIVKELKFQANNAKRDPDKSAQELLDIVEINLYRLERLTTKLRKKLGITTAQG